MAEALNPTIQSVKENFLECSICMEQYTDPRILNCIHSYCFKCIKQHVGTNCIIKCPICNQQMPIPMDGIAGLKSNFFIQGLIDQFTAMASKSHSQCSSIASEICTSCDSGLQTQAVCDGCESDICENCIELHKKIAVLKRHKITLFAKMEQLKIEEHMKVIKKQMDDIENHSLQNTVYQLTNKIDLLNKEEAASLKRIDDRRDIFVDCVNAYVSKLKADVKENTKQRMGNMKQILQANQAKLDSFGTLKEQLHVLNIMEINDKSIVCEQLIEQLKQFQEKLMCMPLVHTDNNVKKKEFVGSSSEEDEQISCCSRFIGFLKPIKTRNSRDVHVRFSQLSRSISDYAIQCSHTAIDKYGQYPKNETTYANIAETIRDMFIKRYSRNEWTIVVSGTKDSNVCGSGNYIILKIDDFEIMFIEFD